MRQITEQQYRAMIAVLQNIKMGDSEALKLYLELISLPAQPEPAAHKTAAPATIKETK